VAAVSLLVLAVLAQPVQHRVEVHGRGGDAFWSAGARGSDLWERVRGEAELDARRPAEGAPSATFSMHLTRGAERWTVELSTLRSGSLLIDGDLPGPGGLVHAAVALGGTARVTRAGDVLTDAASVRALALTTGFHADDGTFRSLPSGRSGDLELLVQVDGLPGGGTLDIGFEHPEIRLDGRLVPAAPLADATAPAWPGARGAAGVGGSGMETKVLPAPVAPLSPPAPSSQPGGTSLPSTPAPANGVPAGPLLSTPPPANSGAAGALPTSPPPASSGPATTLPTTPTPASDAPLLPSTPPPANTAPGLPLPGAPAPANSAPAMPLPSSPAPAGLPGPAHGRTNAPGPTWFPAPLPPTPVPDAPMRESDLTRFARADSKIDPSGQGSTVRDRAHLRARALDQSRTLARIALADRG
jgi:hypothetical protein